METNTQGRKPAMGPEAMAQKGKSVDGLGSMSSKALDNKACHVPTMGESAMATKGSHKDGMAKMMKSGTSSRKPDMATEHTAGKNTNRGA